MECPQGRPGASEEIPTSPWNPSPTLQELFQRRGPGSSPSARVLNTSSELRVNGVVDGKKTSFIVDTGATFSLSTSYSGPTQDSEITIKGVSGVPLRPKISPPLLYRHPYTLMPHNVSVPNGTSTERFVIQIGVLYYHTPPSIQSPYSACRWHLDSPYPSPLTFPWLYLP